MRRSSGRNAFKIAPTRTIMATGVAKPDCNRQVIQNYLQQLFPDIEIRDIQLAYNIRKLAEVAQEYEQVGMTLNCMNNSAILGFQLNNYYVRL